MAQPGFTKPELGVMEKLWARTALSVRQIQEEFPEKLRPAYTTIQTIVERLEEKKAVRCIKKIGNARIYQAAITRNQAQKRLVDNLFALLGGTTQDLMTHMVETGNVTLKEVQEAEKLVRRMKGKGRKP